MSQTTSAKPELRKVTTLMRVVGAGAILFSLVSTTLISHEARGQAYGVKDFAIRKNYLSQRALGMGNAFVGLADDYSALFYNPAGLARLTEGQINLGIAAGADTKLNKFVSDVGEKSKTNNAADMVQLLEENLGNHYSARLPLLQAFWARPNWALAILPVDIDLQFEIHQLATYSLNVLATQDTTIAYGRGWDAHWFDKDRISFGVTGKAIYRGYFNRSVPASDLIFDQEFMDASDAAEGFTFDIDIGMLYTPHVEGSFLKYLRPSLGLVVHNTVDYGFGTNFHLIDKNSKQPPKLQRTFDVGTSFELPDWWIWKTRAMVDLQDIGHENFTFDKGLHAGGEFLWKIRSWWQGGWRAGLSQGYFTAGITAKFGIFNLDVATYADQVGTSDTPKASRVYMAKTSLDW